MTAVVFCHSIVLEERISSYNSQPSPMGFVITKIIGIWDIRTYRIFGYLPQNAVGPILWSFDQKLELTPIVGSCYQQHLCLTNLEQHTIEYQSKMTLPHVSKTKNSLESIYNSTVNEFLKQVSQQLRSKHILQHRSSFHTIEIVTLWRQMSLYDHIFIHLSVTACIVYIPFFLLWSNIY